MKIYLHKYRLSEIRAMLRNSKKDPESYTGRFDNRLLVITGATSGIGYYAVKEFASRGSDIICINRNKKKSVELCNEIEKEYG